MGQAAEYTQLEWDAKTEFHRLSRMKIKSDLAGEIEEEMKKDPKRKYTSREVEKIRARV